jgi:hypothetical protein
MNCIASPMPTSPVSQTGISLVPASQLDISHHFIAQSILSFTGSQDPIPNGAGQPSVCWAGARLFPTLPYQLVKKIPSHLILLPPMLWLAPADQQFDPNFDHFNFGDELTG